MKKILIALIIFITLLITFNGCMSAQHLSRSNYEDVNHSNHRGSNYSSYGGGAHSGGCH